MTLTVGTGLSIPALPDKSGEERESSSTSSVAIKVLGDTSLKRKVPNSFSKRSHILNALISLC